MSSFLSFQWMICFVHAVTSSSTTMTTSTLSSSPSADNVSKLEIQISAKPTSRQTPTSTTMEPVKEKCYVGLGCFNNSAPFNNDETLPQPPDRVGTQFWLYTRRNLDMNDFKTLTYNVNDRSVSSSHFNSTLRTRVIVHGFSNTIREDWIHNIKRAFLRMEDSNIIVVGWGPGASGGYDQAVANTRLVATQLRLLLQRLMQEAGLQLKNVHLIGHSLGAHTSGNTGRQLGGQIGRITGLDPAGPDFQNWNNVVILDKTDAQFVDSIHTNGKTLLEGGAGMSTPTADVDFYVNGGRTQPGCKDGISGLFSGGFSGVACSHSRSHEVFLESITSECAFTAYPCPNYAQFQLGQCLDCEPGGCSELGLYADQHSARGSLFLSTQASPPFCGFHYSVTIHAGRGYNTTGTIYVTLHGSWGDTDVMQVTEEEEHLNSGVDYAGMMVSSVEVGDIQTITVRYNKYGGHLGWSWFGGGRTHFSVDAVDVLSGESGRRYRFCLPTRQLTHAQDLELPRSSSETC